MPKTAAEQDEAIRAIAKTELKQLEVQQEDMVESDPTDSLDNDYQPIPRMPSWAQDSKAGGSRSALPQPPQTDPTLIAILDRMQQEQTHQAQAIAVALAQL